MCGTDPFWDVNGFAAGTPVHAVVIIVAALANAAVVALGRRARRRGPAAARRADRTWGAVLLAVWMAVVAYNLLPSRRKVDRALPLQLCHLVALAAPVAALTRSRTARATVYFGGVGLCTQAFVTPVLRVGPAHADFWVCWGWHVAIVAAIAYELFARRYRPGWRDWRLAVVVTLAYSPAVFAVDWWLGTNYGWMGRGDPGRWTLLSPLGPWPGRVPLLVGLVVALFAGLALAWRHNWPVIRQREPALAPRVPQRVPGRIGSSLRPAA